MVTKTYYVKKGYNGDYHVLFGYDDIRTHCGEDVGSEGNIFQVSTDEMELFEDYKGNVCWECLHVEGFICSWE